MNKLDNPEVDIGFLEESPSWKLESRFFPSKVGGKPAWLNLEQLPSLEELNCKICQKPCIFLCQIYAPFEEYPSCFHRTLFIFVCIDPECCNLSSNKNFKVFRSQLPRVNDYFPEEPPEESEFWNPDLNASKYLTLCKVCGCAGPLKCANCNNTNYCSKEHQKVDWKFSHKQECQKNREIEETNSSILFPEYELVIDKEFDQVSEDEKEEEEVEEEMKEKKNMDLFNEMIKNKSGQFFNGIC